MSKQVKVMPIGRLVEGKELIPPIQSETTDYPAGILTFGFEQRSLDLRAEDIPKVWEPKADAVLKDGGPTIHVWETATRAEYLRFDCFEIDPHYHYNWPTRRHIFVVPYDMFAHGEDMLSWTFRCLRSRLPNLLANSEGAELAGQLDEGAVMRALDKMERDAYRSTRDVVA
jgi:hypothetical protein